MNKTTKTLSCLAVAGMIAGLSVSAAQAAEPGVLVKGKFETAEHSCGGAGDSCEGKDECKSKDDCKGKEEACSGKDGCDGKE